MSHDDDRIPVLVLGLGNVLCADDGVGVVAVHALGRAWEMADGVRIVDGGTRGLDLLPLVTSADRIVMVDAVRADGPAGSPVRLDGDDVAPAVYERLSPHQIGVADLLLGAGLIDRYPSEVVIVGVVPASIELAMGLTDAVAASVPDLIARVIDELRRLGVAPRRRERALGPDDDVRALGLA